jgi:hypothetical protein
VRIDRQWLEKHEACVGGKNFFLSEGILTLHKGTLNLIKKGRIDWANWLVTQSMSHIQKVMYAVYAAKQVLCFYEKCYPADRRPRVAIQAAARFAKNPTEKNRRVVDAAADAAYEAADEAADAAYEVANEATNAADAASAATKTKIILYGLRILKEKRTR